MYFVVIAVALCVVALLTFNAFFLKKARSDYEQELTKALLSIPKLSDDQIAFKNKIDDQWKKVLTEQAKQFRLDIESRNKYFKELTQEEKEKFEANLKAAFDKACSTINFTVVQYEKTIKKRRRKAAKTAVVPSSSIYPTLDDM